MADDPAVLKKTLRARRMLAQSEAALDDILTAFEDMRNQMLTGELSIGDLSKARVALGFARSKLLEEVNKYEKHILVSKGLSAEAPIDFDAIKDQIGRSLDRLRNAQEAGGVSEQSDK